MTFCDLIIYNDNPYWSDFVPNSTFYRILSGFNRTFATGVTCRQGTLTLRTPGSVPFMGTCMCSDCWDQFSLLYTDLMTVPNLTFTELRGFHGAFATGVACQQGALTPPDTWSRPFGTCICSTWWDQSFSKLVVIFLRTMLFVYPSVLSRFCIWSIVSVFHWHSTSLGTTSQLIYNTE